MCTIRWNDYKIEKLAINRTGETPIAALLFTPEGQTEPALAALFGGDGDLDVVRSDWGAGTQPAATVPEPSPLACLGGMWLSWSVCRLFLYWR